ncbi:MAG TPA: polyphenol oxidase family protein [Acidimicrobiia bacterium]|nr:polyphenol oxidase family protein [Acidimicrobiia bacterium]
MSDAPEQELRGSTAPIDLTVGCARIRFTDRRGGVSSAPYASRNLATHVGDAAAAVAENRRRLAAELAVDDASPVVWLDQVHGDTVVRVDGAVTAPPRADAAVTDRVLVPLAVLVADCAPIALVADHAVGVVHAGWAGLEAGVIERAVDALRATSDGPVQAVVGPCIHPARYEFGASDLERLVGRFGRHVAGVTEWDTPAFDLPAAVKHELTRVGVATVVDVDVCTSASEHHFSHRRDGTTGRQAVVVMRTR